MTIRVNVPPEKAPGGTGLLPSQSGGPTLMLAARTRSRLLTVSELIELYLHFRGPELDPKTREITERYLTVYRDDFGQKLVSELNRREFLAWLRSRDNWASDNTKKSAQARIKAMFGWAVKEDDLLDRNPYAGTTWPDGEHGRAMEEWEVAAAYKAACPIFRRLFLFLKHTGARPGDGSNLEYPMIDWDRKVAVLEKHKTRNKTGKPKTIYLSPNCVELLRMLEGAKKHPAQGDLVFCNKKGTKWRSCDIANYWVDIRERAGLPDDCVLYGLRHRYGSLQAMNPNCTPAMLAKLMGHSDVKTTMKYYVHMEQYHDQLLKVVAGVS